MRYILGVDPGLSGALAVLDATENKVAAIYDTPTVKKNKTSTRREIDLFKLSGIIDQWAAHTSYAVIEEVASLPNQGVVSMFTFGKVYGVMLGMLAGYNVPIFRVPPAIWKGALGLSSNKQDSILKAKKLYPGFECLKSKDGQAEALLLAHFGLRFWKNSE